MKGFLSLLTTWGVAAVLVAVCVAWWEHHRRTAAARRERAWSDTEYLDTQAAALDFCLETGSGALPPTAEVVAQGREQTARRTVLDETLSRMAKHKAEPIARNFWADTQPLVSAPEPKPATAASKPDPEKIRLTL